MTSPRTVLWHVANRRGRVGDAHGQYYYLDAWLDSRTRAVRIYKKRSRKLALGTLASEKFPEMDSVNFQNAGNRILFLQLLIFF
jgi:hypothetical protein